MTEGGHRVCDFCGNTAALLYCRADSAKLCISCDREVHSTNQLFTKHPRSLLCDACDSSPAFIFCSTENFVLCQNCDWERHSLCLSSLHDRRPLEGYTGCPSVTEFLAFFGFEDLGKKALFGSDDGFLGPVDSGSEGGSDGFANLNFLAWDTSSIASLDDLMVSIDVPPTQSFQAMEVPPLPKNRNAACGQHKEEMLSQLREMAKVDPNVDNVETLVGFQPLVAAEQDIQLGLPCAAGIEANSEPAFVPSNEANASFQWCSDASEVADQGVPSTFVGGSYVNKNHFVPDKDLDVGDNPSRTNGNHEEGQPNHPVSIETLQALHRVAAVREINSLERDSAISRYKEKKKTRRYDKHIRYESRKVRAESRTRVQGRFAKMHHH